MEGYTSYASYVYSKICRYAYCLLLFTINDFKVIIIPHTIIGLALASRGVLLTSNLSPSIEDVLYNAPVVFLWNWLNLLTFNIANQRLEDSITEDKINKPWRPIPAGLLNPEAAQRLLLASIMGSTGSCYLWLGGLTETILMIIMTWMYNDLGGGSNSLAARHGLNGAAFALHTYTSLKLAASGPCGFFTTVEAIELTQLGWYWVLIDGCIVATTIHVMDFPDVEGDRERERRTAPLVVGEDLSRASLGTAILFWTFLSLWLWKAQISSLGLPAALVALAVTIAWRTLSYRDEKSDDITYKVWCGWLVCIVGLFFVGGPTSM
nr:(+)-Z-alpha-bisabolene synthase [Myrothecium sp.]